MSLLLPLLAFVFATLLVTAAAYAFAPGGATAIERRLGELTGGSAQSSPRNHRIEMGAESLA